MRKKKKFCGGELTPVAIFIFLSAKSSFDKINQSGLVWSSVLITVYQTVDVLFWASAP
jgi:hypothetical protein